MPNGIFLSARGVPLPIRTAARHDVQGRLVADTGWPAAASSMGFVRSETVSADRMNAAVDPPIMANRPPPGAAAPSRIFRSADYASLSSNMMV